MPTRRPALPLWFLIALAVASALVLRVLGHALGAADSAPGQPSPPAVAFLGFLILIGSLIWKGLEVAGKVTLEVLKWVVANLSLVVTKLKNGLAALGSSLLQALKRTWDFTRAIYDDVLKPAWQKFWNLFDRLRTWLKDTFGPVLDWLQTVRKYVVDFWSTYVKPWLDLIDVTRKLLRVLSSLGLEWAKALDDRLGRLEAEIQKPFTFLLQQINTVIGVVNTIMTAGGLFQRLVLVRSLARDYQYAWQAIANPYTNGFDPAKTGPVDDAIKPRTAEQIASAYTSWVKTGTGDRADMYAAVEADARKEYASV